MIDRESRVRAAVVMAALEDIGVPYFWGGNDPAKDGGLDCSGSVLRWMRAGGIPQSDKRAVDLHAELDKILEVDLAKPGDLAFYRGNDGNLSHVVLVISSRARAIVGANGGSALRPKQKGESDDAFAKRRAAYVESMARANASVRLVDHRHGGARYRQELVGFGRLPWERSNLP